ncbi:hypothetical protein M3Y99_01601700 [Aphelenchoides fujianensis]|nr:hypothetical protein M3Y99_01601700 [Aphelenchoides fujianensis]
MARTRQQAWNEEEGRRRVKHENLRLVRAKRRNAGPPPVITIDSDGEREEVDSSREVPQPPATVHVRARPTTLTLKAGERPDAPVRLNGELPDGVRVKRDSDDDAPTAKRKRKMKLVASIDDSFQRVKEERCELEQVAQQQGTTAADFAADGRDYAESLAEQPTEIQSNPPPGNANEEQEDVASEASSGDSNLVAITRGMAGRSKKVIRWPFIGFGRRFEAARPGDQWVSDLFAFRDLRFGRVDFYLRFDPRGFVRYDGRTSAFHVQVCDANSNLRLQLKCTAWLEGVDGTQSRTKSATFNFKGMNIMGWESFLPSEQLAPFEDSPTVFLCCRMSMDVEKVGEPTDETTAFQWEIPDLTERSRSAALKPLWWSPYFHVEKFGAVAFRLGAFPAGFPGEEDDAFELFVAVKNLGGDSRLVFQHSVWLENATGESTPKLGKSNRFSTIYQPDLCVDSILTNLNAKNVAVVVHLAAALGHIPDFRASVLNFLDRLHNGPGGRTARRAFDRRHPELQELLHAFRE